MRVTGRTDGMPQSARRSSLGAFVSQFARAQIPIDATSSLLTHCSSTICLFMIDRNIENE